MAKIPITVYEEQFPANSLFNVFGLGESLLNLENLTITPDKPKAELVNIGGTLYFKYTVNKEDSHAK